MKLVLGLLIAALIAAFFGFGGIATDFADTARLLFFLLAALLVVSSVFTLFGAHMPSGGGALRTFALVAVVAMVSIGVYAWLQNDMSAESAGRVIDREAVNVANDAGVAFGEAGDRTKSFVSATVDDIRADTSDAASEATDGKTDDPKTAKGR